MSAFIKKHAVLIAIISLGVVIRLFFAFSFNHVFDSYNILAITKSEIGTGSSMNAYLAIKQMSGHETQLFGKLYYQIIGVWMGGLHVLGIINLREMFTTTQGLGDLSSFGAIGPRHYELISIKLVQFIFEALFLTFFLKLIGILKPNNPRLILGGAAFWALNFFMIYPTYVPFQSDLAMVSFFTMGVFVGIKALKERSNRKHIFFLSLMAVSFAIGAIIKQVPLLFLIPLLIVVSKNFKSFVISILVFGGTYVLASQPWTSDAALYKALFLLSPESIALIKFSLNGASVFLMLYAIITAAVFLYRNEIRKDVFHVMTLILILFSALYVSEDLSYLYAQFNIWIMPFLFLLMLKDRTVGVFFLAPIVGFFRWALVDNGVATGSLWVTYGKPLAIVPSMDFIQKQLLSPYIIQTLMNSVFIAIYILLVAYLLRKISLEPLKKYVTMKSVIITITAIYAVFFILDFSYRSRLSNLTSRTYTTAGDIQLTEDPLTVEVINPQRLTLTALDLKIQRKSLRDVGSVRITVRNDKGAVLSENVISDLKLPEVYEEYFLPFGKSTSEKKIIVEIAKNSGGNEILVQAAEDAGLKPSTTGGYMQYDHFYEESTLSMVFPQAPIVAQVRGVYPLSAMLRNAGVHMQEMPVFYLVYGSIMGILIIIATGLVAYATSKKRFI